MAEHEATFYVRIEASRGGSWTGFRVESLAARTVTQGKPANLPRDTIAVKLTVRLPDEAFDALTPEAVIVVPADLVQRSQEIDATASDAT